MRSHLALFHTQAKETAELLHEKTDRSKFVGCGRIYCFTLHLQGLTTINLANLWSYSSRSATTIVSCAPIRCSGLSFGSTPLQWAVANVQPLVVNLHFVSWRRDVSLRFPTEVLLGCHGARFKPKINYAYGIKLIRASWALLTIEFSRTRDTSWMVATALTIMKIFRQAQMFEENLEK
ncbi:unnamed protein product, partial [Trichogramma brassicae]